MIYIFFTYEVMNKKKKKKKKKTIIIIENFVTFTTMLHVILMLFPGERVGLVVEHRTLHRQVLSSIHTGVTVLCL